MTAINSIEQFQDEQNETKKKKMAKNDDGGGGSDGDDGVTTERDQWGGQAEFLLAVSVGNKNTFVQFYSILPSRHWVIRLVWEIVGDSHTYAIRMVAAHFYFHILFVVWLLVYHCS